MGPCESPSKYGRQQPLANGCCLPYFLFAPVRLRCKPQPAPPMLCLTRPAPLHREVYGSVFISEVGVQRSMSGSLPLVPYGKPHLNVQGQIALLKARGLSITDDIKAANCLERIGYYRLSGYWYPFRRRTQGQDGAGSPVTIVNESFVPGIEFGGVHDLYVFDKRLRLIFLDAIERVEVGLRVNVALTLGALSPIAHRDPVFLDRQFTSRIDQFGRTRHAQWLSKQAELERRAREDFVVHFKSKYSTEIPIWIAIELWDFGMLSMFLGGIRHAELTRIASNYGLPRRDLLTSWARAINHVRNICAHHGRLWNRSLTDQPGRPHLGDIPELDHLAANNPTVHVNSSTRVYAVAAALQHFLKTINPATGWSKRLEAHIATLPRLPGTDELTMGFPPGWQHLPLWKD